MQQVYEPSQGLTDAQRQEFYDWCVTAYETDPCRYCGHRVCTDPYSHEMRTHVWDIYAALRDSVNQWRDIHPTAEFLDGFYGHDYE